MKQTVFAATSLILLTAAIGIGLWFFGYPPEKEGLSETKQMLREIFTSPFIWAGMSAAFTAPIILLKRNRLASATGKERLLPMLGCLAITTAFLIIQIVFPLDLYQVIGTDGSHVIFFYMIAGFFFFMGNYMVTVPFESKVGFRTRATLSDPLVWTPAHRFLGRSLVMAVLVTLPLPLLIHGQVAQWVLIGLAISMKAITWLHARRLAARLSLRRPVPH